MNVVQQQKQMKTAFCHVLEMQHSGMALLVE